MQSNDTKIKKVTLSELGQYLPIGVIGTDGKNYKDLSVKKWRFKEEKELGELREKHAESNMGSYISLVLSKMLLTLGPYNFEDPKLKDAEKRLIINQLYLGDVFYMYCFLRVSALGKDLVLNLKCAKCKNQYDWNSDLNSLEISTLDSIEDSMFWYDLHEPLIIRGKLVSKIKIGASKWSDIELTSNKTGSNNIGLMKFAVIKSSINELEELGSIPLADHEFDEMAKIDIETLSSKINKNAFGPDMSISVCCPICSHTVEASIDWNFDSFFGISSR